ncbi:MAG: D-alanyl-lipoteichoic acid biosynthesis protein DltD [Anaerolineae bacterium]
MKTPHLVSGLITLLLLLAVIGAGAYYADSVESRYVHALAPAWFKQKMEGSALARVALRQPDLLPIYGASELGYPDPYHANILFKNYPSGFTVFPIGAAGIEPIIVLQELASAAPDLRGKKVVITLSPSFAMVKRSSASAYDGNFSPLHACETTFSTDLSLAWKQAVARRMLEYPQPLTKQPLIAFALDRLAGGSALDLAEYYASLPLGKLQCAVVGLQDHWEVLDYIDQQKGLRPDAPHKAQAINWDSTLSAAEDHYALASNNNPFGFENPIWDQTYGGQPPTDLNGWDDSTFLTFMNNTQSWGDLDLLLRELQELGADPLIFSAPFNATYFDYSGISVQSRQVYYDKLRATVRPFHYYLLDFQDHEADKDFLIDDMFHLSSVGWVYYSLTIDAFYHNRLYVSK